MYIVCFVIQKKKKKKNKKNKKKNKKTIYGRGGHIGHAIRIRWTKYHSPYLFRLHMKFGIEWPSHFWDVWRVMTTDDDGQRRFPKLKSHLDPKGSGEIKRSFNDNNVDLYADEKIKSHWCKKKKKKKKKNEDTSYRRQSRRIGKVHSLLKASKEEYINKQMRDTTAQLQ